MPRNLATATLRSSSGTISIDADAGIIRGVKLMELGRLARFAGEDGQPKSVKITPAHIDALLSHAGNRAIPIHSTHDWFNAQGKPDADSVEMAARIGALKAFRKDDLGNLIGDAHLNKAKPAALDLLWGADSNPEDNCFSVVFSYLKDDPQCIPQNFRAGDVVPSGAATTALFSEDQTQTNMPLTLEDLATLLDDPKAKALIRGCLDAHDDAADDVADDTATAEMEKDADVKPEDKKPEDAQKPALMRRLAPIVRALARRSAAIAADETALLAKVKVQSEAAATAMLGKGGFIQHGSGEGGNSPEAFITAALTAGTAKNRGQAIALMARTKPELYQIHTTR